MSYTGWIIPDRDRIKILHTIRAIYPNVVCHHVTFEMIKGHSKDAVLPTETSGLVVGVADDGHGVQALVVKIGDTVHRPDDEIYHITYSLDHGRVPKESLGVVKRGWRTLQHKIKIRLVPTLFKT